MLRTNLVRIAALVGVLSLAAFVVPSCTKSAASQYACGCNYAEGRDVPQDDAVST